MTPSGQTVCLCMIVKDEAPVIRRCLDAVRPLVDHWLIVDTGSTDGTQAIVREHFRDLPGELVERPWRDFAHNRAEALALARPHGTYSLIIDADDTFTVPAGYTLPDLDRDAYTIEVALGPMRLRLPLLVRASRDGRDEGAARGGIASDQAATLGHLPLVLRIDPAEGARKGADAYRKHAAILKAAPDNGEGPEFAARRTFALAECLNRCGEAEEAYEQFLRRADMGFSEQEIFVSLLTAGRLGRALGRDAEQVLALYVRADAACPSRAEAAHAASWLCRVLGRNREGYEAAVRAKHLTTPPIGLQVEEWIYRFGLLDELAINAYWDGRYAESRDACLQLLTVEGLPDGYRPRIVGNLRFALDALAREVATKDDVVWRATPGDLPPPPAFPRPALVAGRGGSGSVSIITPTRDRAKFLRRAARYVRAQSHADIEWLILDDSAQPLGLPEGFAVGNISYEHSPERLTIGEKRNRLIEKARGETIVHFDDDDYYAPDYVTTMLREMEARDADILNLRGWFLYDLRSRFFGYWDLMVKAGPHYRCGADGVALRVLADNCGDLAGVHFGFGFSYAFRKRVWDVVKFPQRDWNEDGGFIDEARRRFVMDGFHDTSGLSLHIVHGTNTSLCFPQYRLPTQLFGMLFPDLLDWASGA